MAIADVYMLWSMILWGIFAALQGIIRTYSLLLVDRLRGGTKSGAAFSFMAASPLPAGLLMFSSNAPWRPPRRSPGLTGAGRWRVRRHCSDASLADRCPTAPLSPTRSGRPKMR